MVKYDWSFGTIKVKNENVTQALAAESLSANVLGFIAVNGSGSTISKGTPVYISNYSNNKIVVSPADSSDSATLPAIGVAVTNIENGKAGLIAVNGVVSGIDTSAFSNVNDPVYVAVGGGIGTSGSQVIGRVLSVDASSGAIYVQGAVST